MSLLKGNLKVQLVTAESLSSRLDELVDLINQRVAPPVPVTAKDVIIRAMYVVSDGVNSYGGIFPAEDHAAIARLFVDTPVMIGHSKEALPVGRVFEAEVVNQGAPSIGNDGRAATSWVKAYFYWTKGDQFSETLRRNIDSGIYKECSVSFSFAYPECTVCGEDIRQCAHVPFRVYQSEDGRSIKAFFKYRGVERIIETSLVYRGAVPGTRITDQLGVAPSSKEEAPPACGQALMLRTSLGTIYLASKGLLLKELNAGRAVLAGWRSREFEPGGRDTPALLDEVPAANLSLKRKSADAVALSIADGKYEGRYLLRRILLHGRYAWMARRAGKEGAHVN